MAGAVRRAGAAAWETVVGLEVHARVACPGKLFSAAPAGGPRADEEPNSRVAPFDLALPGALPVLNWECVDAAVLTGLALGGRVAPWLCFDRKHYFYPDLPHGFQVTQKRRPVVAGGQLALPGTGRAVRLAGVQLETDTGKLTSTSGDGAGGGGFLLDLNRAGCALMEVVTEPDMRSGAEAAEAARELRTLLHRLGTCRGAMQDGEFRVDVNVSVREVVDRSESHLGRASARREIKNLNSFRRIRDAVEHEAEQLRSALEEGDPLPPQTLGWDPRAGCTFAMRDKAVDLDYRFMPEPDVPPVELSDAYVGSMQGRLEELLRAADGEGDGALPESVPSSTAAALAARPELMAYFQAAYGSDGAPPRPDPVALAVFVAGPMGKLVQPEVARTLLGEASPFPPAECAYLLGHVRSERISKRTAREVCARMLQGEYQPNPDGVEAAIAALGGEQVSDEAEVEALCSAVIARRPEEAKQFRAGRERLLGRFVGDVIKTSGGRANPKMAAQLLRKLLCGRGDSAGGA